MLYFQTWFCCFILKINIKPCALQDKFSFPVCGYLCQWRKHLFCRFHLKHWFILLKNNFLMSSLVRLAAKLHIWPIFFSNAELFIFLLWPLGTNQMLSELTVSWHGEKILCPRIQQLYVPGCLYIKVKPHNTRNKTIYVYTYLNNLMQFSVQTLQT